MTERLSSRRTLLKATGLGILAFATPVRAELTIDLRGGSFKPMPVAVFDFEGEAQAAAQLGAVITNNLRRCGLFQPLDKASFPEKAIGFDAAPKFELWGPTGVQAIVTGRVVRDGNRMRAEFRLWDVAARQQLAAQQYSADPQGWRRIAHLTSDAIFERITGEKGFFDTRIVFIDESGPKQSRKKRLAVMDQDGANYKLLGGGDLVVTPRFSPSSQQVTFMAFGDENPRVFLLDVASGRSEAVGNFPGMSFAPRFSPDGRRVIMSLQEGANANIYALDLASRQPTRLTSTAAIDTSPSYSPDGAQIVFESDRGGGQQLYIMGGSGGDAKRVSFGEGRYSTPVWSPKGDFIAFTKQRGGSFSIGIMKPDGSGERILTEGFHNEGPTWAPNGRYLMFFRDPGGAAGPKLVMVDTTGRVEAPVPTPNYASDPAWSPLLSDLR